MAALHFQGKADVVPRRIPLTDEVARVLRERLAGGFWIGFLPGEHELASELQVSRMTLRAALHQLAQEGLLAKGGHGRRHRILASSSRKGLRHSGASAVPREIRVLSLVPVSQVVGVVQTALIRLQSEIEARGYHYQFTHCRLPPGPRFHAELERIAARPNAAAWVLYCTNQPIQRWFAERKLPCIVLGACFPEIPLLNVEFDAAALGRHAAGEFIRRGHKHLAIVRPSLFLAGDEECAQGLREVAARSSTPIEVSEVSYDPTVEGIRLAMERALRRTDAPTGFLVAQPNFVWPVMGCLQKAGKRIPQDAAVISRGDDLFLKTAIPTVACYVHDGARLGSTAARLVLSLLSPSSHPSGSRHLIAEFVGGESLG